MGERLPLVAFAGELAAAALGQLVDPAAPSSRARPFARKQARSLEPVESGIDRALGEVEGAVALCAQLLDDAVAVQRSRPKRRQEQQVDVAFQYLGSHSIASLGSAGSAVKASFRSWRTPLDRSTRWATACSARSAAS